MKIFVILFTLFIIKVDILYAQQTKMFGTGVVFAKDEFKEINLLNLDGTFFAKVCQTTGGEIKVSYSKPVPQSELKKSLKLDYPYYHLNHKKYKVPLPELSIRAFYTDESVVVFDAIKVNNTYKVFINGGWKIINQKSGIVYQDWASYMKRVYVKADKTHPLYKENNIKSTIIDYKSDNSYKVLAVKGEWIKVACSQECEGCSDNKVKTGWIKWKDNNYIIIDIFYSC